MSDPLRFRVARHDLPDGSHHFDLWLEQPGDAMLRSWRLAALPSSAAAPAATGDRDSDAPIPATAIDPHRAIYLEREGDLGPGRGRVTEVTRGRYRVLAASEERLEIDLAAPDPFRGRFRLDRAPGRGAWTFARARP